MATAGADQTARVWDAESGLELLVLHGLGPGPPELWGQGVHDVAFSPDGKRLGTGGADGTARLWDLETGQELPVISCEVGMLTNIQFSPDGKYLVATGNDGIAKVWDPITGDELLAISGPHAGRIDGMDISSDGSLLVTGSEDGFLKVWDLEASLDANTTVEAATLLVRQGLDIQEPVFSPDDIQVAAVSEGIIRFCVLDIHQLIELGRSRVTRSLTDDECRQYLHLEACPQSLESESGGE